MRVSTEGGGEWTQAGETEGNAIVGFSLFLKRKRERKRIEIVPRGGVSYWEIKGETRSREKNECGGTLPNIQKGDLSTTCEAKHRRGRAWCQPFSGNEKRLELEKKGAGREGAGQRRTQKNEKSAPAGPK